MALVGLSGLEPPTLRLSVVRSSQLSYKPVGGDSRDRTGDLLLARQALSQLSYIPMLSLVPPGRIPSKLNNERGFVFPLCQVPADQDVTNKLSACRRSP